VNLRLNDQHTALATDGLGPFITVAESETAGPRSR